MPKINVTKILWKKFLENINNHLKIWGDTLYSQDEILQRSLYYI